jgi:GNAT superfamily N-acetyltransferase
MVDDSGSGETTYRLATEGDIPAMHAVFVAAQGSLAGRHGFGWDQPPPLTSTAPTLEHLLAHDGDRFHVCEVDGRVVGFGSALVRGAAWYLAWLFIDPEHQGRGIGRRLFDLALDAAPPTRITITGALQPISNGLYARNGLLPTTPVIGFQGPASASPPTGLTAADPTPAALAELDLAGYGFDRRVDHDFWAARATPTLWLRDGAPVAYSYRSATGRIGPIAGRDQASGADALRAELARRPEASIDIPGTCRSMVAAALNARMRIVAPIGLLLLSDDAPAPRSLAVWSYGLF